MNRQAVLNLLNNLEVVDQQGGDEAWMLVEVTPEMIDELEHVGVNKEIALKYGDDEHICILAFACGEGYAHGYVPGKGLVYYEPGSINYLVMQAHENAVNKGWWEEERSFGEIIALIHSEASEALEDFRNGNKPSAVWYEKKDVSTGRVERMTLQPFDDWKPCGIPSELADIVIRVFDACGHYGIDLEREINEKMAYNATRPIRHGGKTL